MSQQTREMLATLFEGAPRFVDRLSAEDTDSLNDLLQRADEIALGMPEDEQIELLNAHPRIGADPATVSALSYREQGYDRDDRDDRDATTRDLQNRLNRLNDAYEQRFGFRFVIFVNGRSRAQIADVIERHLDEDREAEMERALRDVVAIARSRLTRMREETVT